MDSLENLWNKLSLLDSEESGVQCPKNSLAPRLLLAAKFLTKRFTNIESVVHTFKPLWRTQRDFEIKDMRNNLMFFEFEDEYDLERVLEHEPWTYDKHLIHDLLVHCMTLVIRDSIGKSLGTVIEMSDTEEEGGKGQLPKSSGPPKRAQPSTSSQHTDAQSGVGIVPLAKISTTSSSEQVLDSVTAKGKCNVQSAESQETLKAINDDISFKSPTISDVKDRARYGVIASNHNEVVERVPDVLVHPFQAKPKLTAHDVATLCPLIGLDMDLKPYPTTNLMPTTEAHDSDNRSVQPKWKRILCNPNLGNKEITMTEPASRGEAIEIEDLRPMKHQACDVSHLPSMVVAVAQPCRDQ
uniref:DUF4283 domain-containing protein n=1 Tax=Quercus lobata TaxID=97700 RepID=A0A7N2MZQ9_QUELO